MWYHSIQCLCNALQADSSDFMPFMVYFYTCYVIGSIWSIYNVAIITRLKAVLGNLCCCSTLVSISHKNGCVGLVGRCGCMFICEVVKVQIILLYYIKVLKFYRCNIVTLYNFTIIEC